LHKPKVRENTEKYCSTNNITNNENVVDNEYIYVDIKGSVSTPGVYKLKSNSRVVDAIEASGGITESANTRFVNLSKLLNDGDVVVIYSNEEIENAKKDQIIYIDTPCVCEEVKNDACYKDEQTTISGKININTASIQELKTLTGIGEAKAKSIVEYRTKNGNFNVIEDLLKVNGISETIYAKIKENITV
jgi:competence protein ComEA